MSIEINYLDEMVDDPQNEMVTYKELREKIKTYNDEKFNDYIKNMLINRHNYLYLDNIIIDKLIYNINIFRNISLDGNERHALYIACNDALIYVDNICKDLNIDDIKWIKQISIMIISCIIGNRKDLKTEMEKRTGLKKSSKKNDHSDTPNSDGKIGTDCGYILIPEQNINYDYVKNELSEFDWINDMDTHLIIVNILTLSIQYIIDSVSEDDRKNHLDIIVRDIFRRESRKSGDDVLLKDKCYEIINSIKTKNFILAENISDNELYSIIKEKYTNSEMKEFILYIRNILKNKFEKLTTKDISYITERVNTIAHITSNESSSPHSDYLNLYQNAVEYMGFLLQRYDEYGSSLMTYFSCIIDAVINSNTTEEQRNKMRENIDCSPLIKGVSEKENISWGINSEKDEKEHIFFPGEYEKPIENNNRSEIRACRVNGGYYGIVTNTDMNDTFKNCENEKINNIKIKEEIDMNKELQPRNRIEMIDSFLNDFRDFLITKNKNYGDSALRPINVFNKLDSSNSITVRIDDKLSRIINSDELRENDCQDLFGYLILYCISEELYRNNDITTPECQKTEDKINVFINVFRREIKEIYTDVLKDLIDTRQPFAKLTISKKIGMELDNLICKFKESKELVKDDIFFFMILLVSIILENGWTDMKKFID